MKLIDILLDVIKNKGNNINLKDLMEINKSVKWK